MRFNTYGNIENPHIMLIHGAGMGWWNFVNYIEELSKLYYVILPTLDRRKILQKIAVTVWVISWRSNSFGNIIY